MTEPTGIKTFSNTNAVNRMAVMSMAKKEIGYVEEPGNKTKFGKWFGLDGVPWCGIFCSYIYSQAGLPIKNGGYTKGFAGVGTMLANHRDKITTNPQMGDLVILDWQGDHVPDHVELFDSWIDRGAGKFTTVGGNTSPSNLSNGGMVQACNRNVNRVEAFINLIG
jgi:hypothetical protein